MLRHGEGMYMPAHYVCLDRANKQVVVVIRGTMNSQDVLVDLVCEAVSFDSYYDRDRHEKIQGLAHRGFLITAEKLAAQLDSFVAQTLEDNPGFSVTCTGHSLGAGVATMLTMLWVKAERFDCEVRCFAFGAPCSLSHEISQAPFTREHVVSIVVGDDFVSRLSFETVVEMERAVVAFASIENNAGMTEEEKLDLYTALPKEPCKLFCAGRVWLLDSPEFNHLAMEIDPNLLFHSMELSETFLTLHFPHRYLKVIEDVADSSVVLSSSLSTSSF